MEMPIQIIVIFFIVLAVGGAIIGFSMNTLKNAQDDLNEWKNDPGKKDLVVEVGDADAQDIINLANACVSEQFGSVDEKICFALFADTFTLPAGWNGINQTTLERNFTLDTDKMTSTSISAVRVTYHPSGRVIIS